MKKRLARRPNNVAASNPGHALHSTLHLYPVKFLFVFLACLAFALSSLYPILSTFVPCLFTQESDASNKPGNEPVRAALSIDH